MSPDSPAPPDVDTEVVRTAVRDGVHTIRLSRPHKYNAITTDMILMVSAALESAERDPSVRAVILTGTGGVFAAGADIGEYSGADHGAFARFSDLANALCTRICTLRVPVLAAVNGPALGGGFEIVLSCDLVLASTEASFGLPEIALGLIPGWGGTQRLVGYVGPNRARELVLTGARLTAQAAADLGIVNRICEPDRLLPDATALAAELATGPRLAIAAARRAIRQATPTAVPGAAGFALEQAELRGLFDTADGREGVHAFVDKRPAVFRGA